LRDSIVQCFTVVVHRDRLCRLSTRVGELEPRQIARGVRDGRLNTVKQFVGGLGPRLETALGPVAEDGKAVGDQRAHEVKGRLLHRFRRGVRQLAKHPILDRLHTDEGELRSEENLVPRPRHALTLPRVQHDPGRKSWPPVANCRT
jgi:hypothetical protein